MAIRKVTAAVSAALATAAIGVSLTACSSSSAPAKPSVAACTAAYPDWYAASFAAGKTTATPSACKGLTDDQISAIASAYMSKLANNG